MGSILGDILPQAIGVAVSPVPIIAVILMLFGKRARSNGPAFALGWVLALLAVGAVVMMMANAGRISAGGTPSTLAYVARLLIGVLFLYLALKQWRGRPRDGETPQMPKWMSAIDDFSTGKAFGMGALLAGVNPKNLGLTLAAALTIAQAVQTGGSAWASLGLFVLIASLSVAAPVIYYLVAGQSAEKTLQSMKTWLTNNNATVMFILFLVLGAKLIGDGLGGLLG